MNDNLRQRKIVKICRELSEVVVKIQIIFVLTTIGTMSDNLKQKYILSKNCRGLSEIVEKIKETINYASDFFAVKLKIINFVENISLLWEC